MVKARRKHRSAAKTWLGRQVALRAEDADGIVEVTWSSRCHCSARCGGQRTATLRTSARSSSTRGVLGAPLAMD